MKLCLLFENFLITFSSDLPEVMAFIVEDLDAVGAVVGDEDLLAIVDDDAVRELQVLGAAELVEHVAQLIEDDDAHDLTLDHNDSALVVHAHSSGMLQNVGTKLADKLSVLVVNLHLKNPNFSKNSNFQTDFHT